MWERMYLHHENQLSIVSDLRSIDVSQTPRETTWQHHKRTAQLEEVIQKWHSEFEKLVIHLKQYVRALNSWLKLNLIPIESNLKEKISSPSRAQSPPIQALLVAWQDFLEKLPDEIAKTAISAFGAVIRTIMVHQEEELKLKDKYEETRKEFLRKNQVFEEWYQKYLQRRGHDEADREEDVNPHDPVMEKRAAVESLRKRMEEEVEKHQRLCAEVREKSLGSLKTRLPELFRAMADYSHACSDSYARLRAVSQMHKSNVISS